MKVYMSRLFFQECKKLKNPIYISNIPIDIQIQVNHGVSHIHFSWYANFKVAFIHRTTKGNLITFE